MESANGHTFPPRPRATILAVDDDPSVREAYELILRDDYRLLAAADGRTALALVATRSVQVALLDILLPGADGLEILRDIRAESPGTSVVMVTGVRTVVTAVEAMRRGAVDYLTKPFGADEVRRAVAMALARQARCGCAQDAEPRRAEEGRLARSCIVMEGDDGWRVALALMIRCAGMDAIADHAGGRMRPSSPGRLPVLIVGQSARGDASSLAELQQGAHSVFVVGNGQPSVTGSGQIHGVDMRPGYFAEIVGRVAAQCGHGRTGPIGTHVSRAVEHLAAHYGEPVSLPTLAATLNISESHLAHTFRAELGVPPKQFLTSLRLGVADALIGRGDVKVSRIARKVGFFDVSHMARVQRRHRAPVVRSVHGKRPPVE